MHPFTNKFRSLPASHSLKHKMRNLGAAVLNNKKSKSEKVPLDVPDQAMLSGPR